MSIRYATIVTSDDGHDIVSAIGVFEGTVKPRRAGQVKEVVPGVLIGMVRGGPVDAVGGFGFPLGSQGIDGRAIGIARTVLAKAVRAEPAAIRGEAAPLALAAPAEVDAARPAWKPVKARRAKSRKGRKSAGRTARSKPASAANAAALAVMPGGVEPGAVLPHG
jgi:hypothetical protein